MGQGKYHIEGALNEVLGDVMSETRSELPDAIKRVAKAKGWEVFVLAHCRAAFNTDDLNALNPAQLDSVCRYLVLMTDIAEASPVEQSIGELA